MEIKPTQIKLKYSCIRMFVYFSVYVFFSIPIYSQTWDETRNEYNNLIDYKNYDKALKVALHGLELAKTEFGDDSKYYASNLGTIGEIYYLKRNFNKAIEFLVKAKDLKKKIYGSSDENYAIALHNLSTIYHHMGYFLEAEPLMREALEIKRINIGKKDSSYAKSLHMLAEINQKIGNYKDSEDLFNESLEIKRSFLSQSHSSIGLTLQGLGNLYSSLGNYSKAKKCFVEIVNIYIKEYGQGHPKTLSAQSALAKIYLSLGEKEKAAPLLEKTSEHITNLGSKLNPDYIMTLYNYAMLLWELKKYKEAEKYIKQTKKIIEDNFSNSHFLYSSCLNSLGILNWVQGNLPEALNNLGNATNLREQIYGPDHPTTANSYHSLAGLLKEAGDFIRADDYYDRAFKSYFKQIEDYFPFLSENEKAKFDAKLKQRFNMFYCYVLERYKDNTELISQMYNYRIATKAILLNSSKKVREIISTSSNPELVNKFEEWRAIRKDLSKLYNLTVIERNRLGTNPDSLEQYANLLEKEISLKSDNFKREYAKKKITWRDIRNKLEPGQAAVEIIRFQFFDKGWTDKVYYVALIITKNTVNHPEIVILDRGKEMENLYINNYTNSIKFKLIDTDSYSYFWEEIDAKLKKIKTIYLSMDGVYNKININSLLKPDNTYVISNKDIIYITNSGDIVNKSKDNYELTNRYAYLLGSPNFDAIIKTDSIISWKYHISPLPGAKKEIKLVDSMLTNNKFKTFVYESDSATEESLRNYDMPGIIHLATHGYFEEIEESGKQGEVFGVDIDKAVNNPLLRSGLLFAGASNYMTGTKDLDQDNGILTAYEVMNLKLDSISLVILSACDTGLGEIRNGEGVFGLQRSFLVAGADKVLMSLWKISDQATQELIFLFYQNYLDGQSYGNALKSAQLELMAKYPHPYYWGAFIIIQ